MAVDWVRAQMRRDPAVQGGFFSGSTVALPDEAVLSASSDVDVLLVRDEPGVKLGKFRHRGVLLEVVPANPMPAVGRPRAPLPQPKPVIRWTPERSTRL
ncbi:hypothetical protein [Micromonospora sp. RTP1Z1]|uniref:hypothetical protein n=1 Tax=Micromonospora sp. RTP1Z1 TaxID=2994043 RepID=UPI0029C626FA|nr:hypothetical protein [Micromonospora sp. RTP1Z1]